jgi:hypothetical protein
MYRMRSPAWFVFAVFTGLFFTATNDAYGIDVERFEAVNLGNGSVRFTIRLAHKKSLVQLHVQKNGAQEECTDITSSGTRNGDGSWTYSVIRLNAYAQNDILTFRFQAFVPGIDPVCYPHGQQCSVASDYEWSEPFLYSMTSAPEDSLLPIVSRSEKP